MQPAPSSSLGLPATSMPTSAITPARPTNRPASRMPVTRSDGLKRIDISATVSGTAAMRIAVSELEMYCSPTGITVNGMTSSMTANRATQRQRSRTPRNAPTRQAIGVRTSAPMAIRLHATNSGEVSSTATLMRKYGMPQRTETAANAIQARRDTRASSQRCAPRTTKPPDGSRSRADRTLDMDTRRLGSSGPAVSAIGLGCMGMSPDLYGPADEDESVATIHAAIDAGITLLDTGDFYGMGHNELLIARALQERSRDDVLISGKFGAQRGPDGAWLGYDARPQALKAALAYTLRRLRTDHVDVYRPARLDSAVPIEETAGAIGELIDAGYVRHMGLSEVGADTIRRAHAVTPICDLQIEYSLISRGIEAEILPACRELGIGITAYGVLSRGLISGHWTAGAEGDRDFRAHSPRFAQGNVERNLELVEALRAIAGERAVTVAQLAIAWVLDRGEDIVPLIGARRRERLTEALGALDVELDATARERIAAAVPRDAAAGDRYAAAQMAMLDS